ncbi:MAG: hypothetical protein LBQ52_05465 [Helicobacteraceae bacterium]|jgi:hypothetical protein|nr:hypothetical protein [Helicobacteraceae bacterium]
MPNCGKTDVCAINMRDEWAFIVKETHSKKPSLANRLEREVLLLLQVLLAKKSTLFYLKIKRFYLSIKNAKG